jgi:hypothetical protein
MPLPAEIQLPFDWCRTVTPGPVIVTARPAGWAGAFTPVITVTRSGPSSGAGHSARRAGPPPLGDSLAALGGHIVHLSAGVTPQVHLDVTLAVELHGLDLTITQRHLLGADGEAIVATGMAADDDWADVAPVLMTAVRSLRSPRTGP